MYDYKVSIHNHLDSACRAFAQSHNLEQLAKSVGMRPATLRCKLNPDQPHQLGASADNPPARNTPKRSDAHRRAGAAAQPQNKRIADKNGTTPHPPTVFGS